MKKYIAGIIVLGVFLISAPSAKALTISDLSKEIEILKGELVNLRAELQGRVLGMTTVTQTSGTAVLKGMRGSGVVNVQNALQSKGFIVGKIDGIFGPLTEAAVKSFQVSAGLQATGIVDSATSVVLLPAQAPSNNCGSSNVPSITVVSPNGGEVYLENDQAIVTWTSCHIPANASITIDLIMTTPAGTQTYNLDQTTNSGEESVIIPNSASWPSLTFGQNYKVQVKRNTPNQNAPSDSSDSLFTIAQPQSSSLSTTPMSSKVHIFLNNPGDGNDLGFFQIEYEVNALDSDIYIPKIASASAANAVLFSVDMAGVPETAGLTTSLFCISCTETANNYLVYEGQTQIFILTVVVDNALTINGSGNYRVKLENVRWNTDNSTTYSPYIPVPLNDPKYMTPYLYLN